MTNSRRGAHPHGEQMNNQLRQGDVLLIPGGTVPDGATAVKPDNGRVVLAYGEVTGHCHSIDEQGARLFEASGLTEDRFLVIDRETELTHQEHATITLEPGTYTVRRQREYDDENEVRRVAD